MGVPISNVTRRVVYAASGTGPYNFTFEILAAADIAVYKDDTLLTLTTDYTVHINTNGTGYVTLTASPTGATQIAIVGNRTIERTTDFVTGGDFFANTINSELDQQTIFAQQNAEALARALTAPQTDPTNINMTLPRASARANKYLAFDSDGNPKPGDTAVEVAAIAAIASDITTVSGISSSVTAVAGNATNINTVKNNITNVNTVAGISSNVTTVAGITSNISTVVSNITAIQNASTNATSAASSASAAATAQTAAEAARDATLTAYDNFDDRYLGVKSSDPSVDNDGNALVAGSLYFNSGSGAMKVYTGSAWVAAYVSGSSYLPLAGGTMTGAITFHSSQTLAASKVTGLATVATTGAYSDLTGKPTLPSGAVVGTTDTQTLTNKTITSVVLNQTKVAVSASAIDLATGNYFSKTISTTTTFTVSNTPSTGTAASFILDLTNGGSATVNWWTGVKWAGGTAPTLTSSGRDVLGFFTHDGGTTWTGLVLGKDVK